MKRYDFKAHFDPYYGCDVAVPEEHSDGEWVTASVAQALYDALNRVSLYLDTSCEYNEVIMDILADSAEALALADGEE